MFRTAGEAVAGAVRIDAEAELGCDDYFVAEGGEAITHEFFVREWPVDLGRVEEGDAVVNRRVNHLDRFGSLERFAIGRIKPHAAITES
ncbi:hypothetical protein ACVWW2_003890 [Bradyrhizobium sp. LM4.3]